MTAFVDSDILPRVHEIFNECFSDNFRFTFVQLTHNSKAFRNWTWFSPDSVLSGSVHMKHNASFSISNFSDRLGRDVRITDVSGDISYHTLARFST